jgi:hypothetical protein
MRYRCTPVLCLTAALAAGLIALAGHDAHASDLQVQAEVSQTLLTPGAQVDYTITLTSDTGAPAVNRVAITKMPQFENLRLLTPRPGSSSESSGVNGVWTHKLRLTWSLAATQEGAAKVTAAQVQYDGKPYDLPEIAIKVTKDQATALPEELIQANVLPAQTKEPAIDAQLAGKLFTRLIVSNPKPYLQETIVAECQLYIDGSILNAVSNAAFATPSWGGFYVADGKIANPQPRPVTLGGRRYQVVTIGRLLLTPTRTGTIEMPLSEAQCIVTVQSRNSSFEDQFFGNMFGQQLQVRLPMAATKIEVRPLPTEGRPASFQNAVGQFAFAARVDRTAMTEDDLLTLRCEIGGEGFLGSVAAPRLPELSGWELAGPAQAKTEAAGGNSAQQGKKVFEFVLRPHGAGPHTVPAIAYAFFDSAQQRYVEQTQGPFQVAVAKGQDRPLLVSGAQGSPGAATGGQTSNVPDIFGERLAYIHTAVPRAAALPPPLYARGSFATLALGPLVLLGLAFGARGWHDFREENRDRLTVRSAGARARRELRGAAAALARNDLDACPAQISEAMRHYLATKLGRSAAGMTLDEVEASVRERGLAEDAAQELRRLLERCDQARYAPGSADAEATRRVYDDAAAWLLRLDALLGARGQAGGAGRAAGGQTR